MSYEMLSLERFEEASEEVKKVTDVTRKMVSSTDKEIKFKRKTFLLNFIFLYYASSDTRLHVAKTSVPLLLDWVENTPEDPLFSADCVKQRIALIEANRKLGKAVPRGKGA